MSQEREDYDDREPTQRTRRVHPAVRIVAAALAGLLILAVVSCIVARIMAEWVMVWS
jgi:hypothetical protein